METVGSGDASNLYSKAAKGIFKEPKRYIRYVRIYKRNVEKFKKKLDVLMARRATVQQEIDAAKRGVEKIKADPEDWFDRVDKMIEEDKKKVKELEDKAKKKCFIGLCPNIKSRYQLSRKVEDGANAVDELLQQGNFNKVSYRDVPEDIVDGPPKDFEAFESRGKVFNDIMETLKDSNIRMIGVYGMAGVGKTTLVNEVARQAKKGKLLDAVVMGVVNQTPDIQRIQNQIAESLGLKFEERSVTVRARCLCERLKIEKKILVVLDDLWARLDLKEVGIPFGEENKGCRILLTSRDKNVLTTEMNAQKIFQMGVLEEKEAGDLFQKMAGNNFESPEFQSIAIEVAERCAGLPLAIVTVGRALRNKDFSTWNEALRSLQRPSPKGITEELYSAVELSYNHLASEELRQTLLLCSLPGPHYVAIQDLLKYSMGLGLFNFVNTVEETRDRLLSALSKLKASCLLHDSHSTDWVHMHDLIRDVALVIASKDNNMFALKHEDVLQDWPDADRMKMFNMITLNQASISELPEGLYCPQLTLFYMCGKNPDVEMPSNFFTEMKNLKVLNLTKMYFSCLPSSISVLTNLRTLCLDRCVLKDIALIGELKNLEILSLLKSDIKMLPKEIGQLIKLRLLDLKGCTKLKIIPAGVLSSLSRLEELYMGNSFVEWEVERHAKKQTNATLAELKFLTRLTTLEIHIPDAKVMPGDLFSEKLERYKIFIGEAWDWDGKHEYSRILRLEYLNRRIDHLDDGIKMLSKKTEELFIDDMEGSKIALHGLIDEKSFGHLKNLRIQNCWDIQYIIDDNGAMDSIEFLQLQSLALQNLPQLISFSCENQRSSTSGSQHELSLFSEKMVFPSLKNLFLSSINVERIWHHQLSNKSFCSLENLTSLIVDCSDNLKHLFSSSMVRSLANLECLEIIECERLKEIIFSEEEEIREEVLLFPQLNSLKMKGLWCLTGFCPEDYKIEFPSLKLLEIECCPALKGFMCKSTVKENQHFSSEALFDKKNVAFPSVETLQLSALFIPRIWNKHATTTNCSQYLRNLIIEGCHNLKCLFSLSVAGCLVQLRRLDVIDCIDMTEIIETEETLEEVTEAKIVFPRLTFLRMKNLREFRGFYLGNSIIEFPCLKELIVGQCPKLEIFSRGVLSTPMLWNMVISEGGGFRWLWAPIRLFFKEKLKEQETEEEQGKETVLRNVMKKETEIETVVSPAFDIPSPTRKQESYQSSVPERAEPVDEAQVILAHREFDKPYPADVELTEETAIYGQVEELWSATERVPSSTAQNLKIITQEENVEAAHSQKEEDQKVPEVTENVSQSIEPNLSLALYTPGARVNMESGAVIPWAKDNFPVIDEMKAEILSQPIEAPEIQETGEAAMTTIEHYVSKILECLDTDTVRRIALHGVCGLGKTSVLRALAKHPKTERSFDLVVWVTVSKYRSLKKIQDQIVRQLPPASSSADPFTILKGKKVLLLLDDVWERIDLQEMGIPYPTQENGSMMILATRELKVCHDMETRVVEIEPVSMEEAWRLFLEQVRGVSDSPSIQRFAKGIVQKCCGLPLFIIVTGRALADEKDVLVWERAFNELSLAGRDIKSCIDDQIQLLRFSFDRLKSPSLKSCFLYCALFSENQEINTVKFVDDCIQERLIAGTWTHSYKRGHDVVDALLHALLVETTEDGQSIRMRDVMRELAFRILSSETEGCQFLLMNYPKPLKQENRSSSISADAHQFVLRIAGRLAEPLTEEEWKESKTIFLMDNKLSTLPEKPSCPDLRMLFLQRNYQLRGVPDHFFDDMPSLELLNLSKTRIKFLPKSISKLGNLEILLLRDCERLVKLPSEVGSLQLLQVLDLGGTEIIELAKEIGELASLRHLEVSFYGSSTSSEKLKLPRGLISRLQALETLSISVYPGDSWWNKNVKSFIEEVSNLRKLTSLSFYFPEVKFLELFLQRSVAWNEKSLREFKFVVGRDVKFNASRIPKYVELNYGLISGQCLRFVNSEKIPDAVLTVLASCTALYLDHHLGIRRLSELGIGNVNKLRYCIISECPYLETVVDCTDGTEIEFTSLEHLSIHYSWGLTCIWSVVRNGGFVALRTLSLHACPKLTYAFKSSMLKFLSNLKELLVDDCKAIEEIVSTDEISEATKQIVSTEEVDQSGRISLKSLRLHYLPKLLRIWEGTEAKLLFEYITIYDCPLLKQNNIDSELQKTLKGIRAEQDWWEESQMSSQFKAIFTPIREVDVHSS